MRAHVIGNITIDETISVSAMPRAGESILGREETRNLGGKGANQAIVMARAGLPTTLVTAVGDDFRAEMIRQQIEPEPVEARFVTKPGRSSDFSMILTTPDGENAIVTTTDAAASLTLTDVLASLDQARPKDLVVLQGNLLENVTAAIMRAARQRHLSVAFNPSPMRSGFGTLLTLCDTVFVNRGEAEALAGGSGESATAELLAAGAGRVVLTLGSEGAVLAMAGGMTETVPAISRDTVDTTGAGDTFMAVALASAALRETSVDLQALEHATAAASLTVGRRGTHAAFPSVVELESIFTH